MTAILIGTGPCWTLSHQIDWESWEHYDSEIAALMELAREIDRALDRAFESCGQPKPTAAELMADPWAVDLPELIKSRAERETMQCCRIRCDSCGDEAGWEDGTTPTNGDHFLTDQLSMLQDWGWRSAGNWDSCPFCPVPEEAVRAHEEEQARRPGPNDVPLFEVPDPGDES